MTDTTRHQTDASFSSPKKERALRSPDVRRETDESYKSPERSDGDFEKIALPEIFVTRIRERGYKIDTDKHITSGTFSSIYYAKKYNSDGKKAHLAAKVIDLARTPTEVREKFIPRELWCITKLHHKFIIQVYDVFTSSNNKHVVILMELAKGGDLLSYLTHANKAASESRAKIWFKQVTLALNYLHENKVAHRDLKSENILLDEHHDVAKLSDFGFARVTVDTRTGRRLLSETYCGTTGYIAPEILDGKPYDPLISDAWSLGVILYVMTNFDLPFEHGNLRKLQESQKKKKWTFAKKYTDRFSDDMKQLINSLLEPNVKSRLRVADLLRHPWLANVKV